METIGGYGVDLVNSGLFLIEKAFRGFKFVIISLDFKKLFDDLKIRFKTLEEQTEGTLG